MKAAAEDLRVAGTPRCRVLLVEDNPIDAMRIRQLLARSRRMTFEVDSTATLGVAQERAAAGDFDLVLLDLDLPDSLGLETFSAIATMAPQLPVVVLARAVDEAQAAAAIPLGAQDVVLKSQLCADGLARTIRAALDRHRLVMSLRGQSLSDELTGLLNRRGFTTIAQGHLRLAGRTGHRFTLFYLDLDDLKRINDTFGHAEGDLAIVRVGEVLRRTFRQSDVVARFGGDEFVVLALDTSNDEGATIRRRLVANLAQENATGSGFYQLGVSIGTIPLDGRMEEPLGALLARADRALYAEKRARGRGRPGEEARPSAPARRFAVVR